MSHTAGSFEAGVPIPVGQLVGRLARQTFLFGPEAAGARLGTELDRMGWERVFVVASRSSVRSGLVGRMEVTALAGRRVLGLHADARPHAPVADIERIAREVAGCRPQALVAIGGGSTIDTAKGVALLLHTGSRWCDQADAKLTMAREEPAQAPRIPLVAVPTTLSGAEVTAGAGATTAAGEKLTFQHDALAAQVVAYDPEVLAGVPTHVLVTTGFNGIAHCAEGLYTGVGTALSVGWATLGAQALADGLRSLTADRRDPAVYEQLGAGAALGGLVVRHAGTALHHAICHELGGFLGVPHGVANAVMLSHVLRFNLPETRRVQAVLAQALGDRARDLPDALDRLGEEIGAPRRLRDTGIRRGDLAVVAEQVMSRPGLAFNPRPVASAHQVHRILEAAW